MNVSRELALQLEEIITKGLEDIPIPYQKGNSIRLKNIVIRKHKNGYKLFDCAVNSHIVTTFTKTAALAVAKNIVEKQPQNVVDEIIRIDDKVAKHYMDALFSKRSCEVSKDPDKRENSRILFDISMDKAWSSLEAIEDYIFDK